MSSETRMLAVMKMAAMEAVQNGKPMEFTIGTVESADPELAIRISQKILLTQDFLVLSRNVTDYETEISFDDPDILQKILVWDDSESEILLAGKMSFQAKTSHAITIYNALKAGEKVILLRLQGGGKYLVVDRLV